MCTSRNLSIAILVLLLLCALSTGCKDKDKWYPPVFQITTPSPIVVPVGAPNRIWLKADYGTAPYQDWTITSGSLPSGYSLTTPTGLISGCEFTEGTYEFTVEVTDSSDPPRTVNKDFTFEVKQAEWTVLLYMNADNDIEECAIKELNDIEMAGGSGPRVNIVAQVDRHPGYDSSNGNWSDCKRLYVIGDHTGMTISSIELEDLGEINMCTDTALQDFLEWAIGRFKSDKYALILWDHGLTWKAYGVDETDGYDKLDITEVHTGIENALATCSIPALDLLGFDACLCGTVEAFAQFRDTCRVMVGSAEVTSRNAWNFEMWVDSLRNNPAATARDLGSYIVQAYEERCKRVNDQNVTLAAFDLANAGQALLQLETVMDFLRTCMAAEGLNIALARTQVDTYSDVVGPGDTAVDIGDLLYVLRYTTIDSTLQNLIDTFLNSLNSMVVRKYCGPPHQYAIGLSVFFPEDEGTYQSASARYAATRFAAEYSWDELLADYYTFKSNYTGNITAQTISCSGTTVSPDTPVQLTVEISGDGIHEVKAFMCKVEGAKWHLYFWDPSENNRTLPNGREIENWSSSTTWQITYQWISEYAAITDGSTVTTMIYDFWGAGFLVGGQYSTDGGSTWDSADAYFAPDGSLAWLFIAKNGMPSKYHPVAGDLFKPWNMYLDPSTLAQSFELGPTLDATQLSLTWAFADPGEYVLFIQPADPFGNAAIDGAYLTVP